MWKMLGILVLLLFGGFLTYTLIQCDPGEDAYAACVLDEMGQSVEKVSDTMANLGRSLNAALPRFPFRR